MMIMLWEEHYKDILWLPLVSFRIHSTILMLLANTSRHVILERSSLILLKNSPAPISFSSIESKDLSFMDEVTYECII